MVFIQSRGQESIGTHLSMFASYLCGTLSQRPELDLSSQLIVLVKVKLDDISIKRLDGCSSANARV